MNNLRMIRELIQIAILLVVLSAMLIAALAPGYYGLWLQKIDTARFEMLDCDCTESLE